MLCSSSFYYLIHAFTVGLWGNVFLVIYSYSPVWPQCICFHHSAPCSLYLGHHPLSCSPPHSQSTFFFGGGDNLSPGDCNFQSGWEPPCVIWSDCWKSGSCSLTWVGSLLLWEAQLGVILLSTGNKEVSHIIFSLRFGLSPVHDWSWKPSSRLL